MPSEFPRRSKSIICANAPEIANAYTSRFRGSGVYAIFPFNGVKIGVCGSVDIWDNDVKPITTCTRYGADSHPSSISLTDQNSEFAKLGLDDTDWDGFVESLHSQRKRDPAKFDERFMGKPIDEIISHIRHSYGEVVDSFTATTTSNPQAYSKEDGNKELWVGGKCVAIHKGVWLNLVDEMK
jgi:hypothetical protein